MKVANRLCAQGRRENDEECYRKKCLEWCHKTAVTGEELESRWSRYHLCTLIIKLWERADFQVIVLKVSPFLLSQVRLGIRHGEGVLLFHQQPSDYKVMGL